MRTVLQPRNTAMAELFMSHADLIDETRMPPSLVALCAHAQYYETLRARWDEGDFERYIPYLVFPVDVTRDLVEAFNRLKVRQAGLLERRRVLRRRKTPTITHADYTAELQDYIKRYQRDAQLEEAADTYSPAGSDCGHHRGQSQPSSAPS